MEIKGLTFFTIKFEKGYSFHSSNKFITFARLISENSSVGRVSASQAESRGFESRFSLC